MKTDATKPNALELASRLQLDVATLRAADENPKDAFVSGDMVEQRLYHIIAALEAERREHAERDAKIRAALTRLQDHLLRYSHLDPAAIVCAEARALLDGGAK